MDNQHCSIFESLVSPAVPLNVIMPCKMGHLKDVLKVYPFKYGFKVMGCFFSLLHCYWLDLKLRNRPADIKSFVKITLVLYSKCKLFHS